MTDTINADSDNSIVPTDTTDVYPSSVTPADLIVIERAIKTGTKIVKFRDREREYRSLDDLLRVRSFIIRELRKQAGQKGSRPNYQYVTYSGRGY